MPRTMGMASQPRVEDHPSPPHVRAQLPKGKNILPPSSSKLKGNLSFKTKEEKDQFAEVCKRKFPPCKYVLYSTLLEGLGVPLTS